MARKTLSAGRLLSVDWDYFLAWPEGLSGSILWKLHEWDNQADVHERITALWHLRIADLDDRGFDRPQPIELDGFWRRFRIAPDAPVYVADSHKHARHRDVRCDVAEVWSYDAHHDGGYGSDPYAIAFKEKASCQDWLAHYALSPWTAVHMRYPIWRWPEDEPEPAVTFERRTDERSEPDWEPDVEFDRVFVCRSSGWMPPYLDGAFERFLKGCQGGRRIELEPVWPRAWDELLVDDLVSAFRTFRGTPESAGPFAGAVALAQKEVG